MPKWERGPSPAAAAAVSRALSEAGIVRSTEIAGGVYSQGFTVDLQDDHVRVEYANSAFRLVDVSARLYDCTVALQTRGYDVKRVTGEIAVPGGWEPGEFLEVRA